MDPANVLTNTDPEETEAPSAMQRLQWTEGEVRRMSGDIAALLQLGQQQQQQYQQQQQLLQQQQQQLATLTQLLTRELPSADPSAGAVSAAPPVSPLFPPPVQPMGSTASGFAEPRVGSPEKFNGDPAQVRAFITNCRLVFDLQPRNFATEAARVAFTINHLSGRARLWGTAEFERRSPACSSFHLLAQEMIKVFDIGSSPAEASRSLMSIRQGQRTVADYSIDFRTLASRSNWNSEALVDAYLHSLADYLKDELVSHAPPANLDDAIALTARIDRRIQARRREKGRQSRPVTRSSGGVGSTSAFQPPSVIQQDPPEAMEVGRASLTAAERRRRLSENLCLYCGGEGHRVSSCPLKGRAHRTVEESG